MIIHIDEVPPALDNLHIIIAKADDYQSIAWIEDTKADETWIWTDEEAGRVMAYVKG
jgi:hypothetical protein